MPADFVNLGGFNVRGRVTIWQIDEKTGLRTPISAKSNQIQIGWGYIAAKQIGYRHQPDRDQYHISGMYFEYENQSNPALPVTTTSFDRLLGADYYTNLASHQYRDFLRVPLRLEPTLGIAAGSEGAETLDDLNQGNQLTFFAQTSGTQGVHGKNFSHIANSKVYSAALVAMPKFDDRLRDVVFARINFDVGDQTSKEASSQIGLTWDISFE
jgi:hypothetical protein